MKTPLAIGAALMLAACGGGGEARPEFAAAAPRVPVPGRAPAKPGTPAPRPLPPGAVMGQTARGLIGQFGNPLLDVTEGTARKLQFGNAGCVLDAYLYPPANGRGEPTVTFAEARRRDGSDTDPGACAATLRPR